MPRANRFLRIYLNDQLGAGVLWREVARRAQRNNEGTEVGAALGRVAEGVAQDVETFDRLMRRLGIRPSRLKPGLALASERAGRLKLNGQITGYSPLSRFEELDFLVMGIEGKKILWASLRDFADLGAELPDVDFEQLIERAASQRAELEPFRAAAGREAFAMQDNGGGASGGGLLPGAHAVQRATRRWIPRSSNGSEGGRSAGDQLIKYLTDVHSIEVQALAQLERAPGIAGSPRLAEAFDKHLHETREHERLIREALEERGADTSGLKDLAGRLGGWAMIAFARLNPDTPGKLAAHAFSYEHMELAAYELLARAARHAGDQSVVDLAERIAAEERTMGARLAAGFDEAVEASLREKDADGIEAELVYYLRDAYAIEAQAVQLLQAGPPIAGFDALAEVFREHLEETREQQRLVDARLRAHGAGPSRVQNTGMRIGGLNIGAFFAAQPDTPAKLAGFAFAFEHLEIAAYGLLSRIALRAGDDETVQMAHAILVEEHRAAERIAATWDGAVVAALEKVGAR